jgi:hypothetical protein
MCFTSLAPVSLLDDLLFLALSFRIDDFSDGSPQPILVLPPGLRGLIEWQAIGR